MLVLLSLLANVGFLLVSLPAWIAATFVGWLIWYFNADATWSSFYMYQLIGFLFAIPALAMRGANFGVGFIAAGLIGYLVGKNVTKL